MLIRRLCYLCSSIKSQHLTDIDKAVLLITIRTSFLAPNAELCFSMSGIYIHIPFCKQACSYCNFYFSTSPGNKKKLLKALLEEVELTKDYLNGTLVETLYIGGGTPSLLEKAELMSIVNKIEANHDL